MDEKLNDLLIQEINKSIERLNGNKELLIEELKKYEGRYGAIEKAELEQDLSKIDSELEQKRLDKAKIETRREIVAQIKEEQARADKEYQKLLKEREDCKAEINGLEGKKEFVNGVLVPTREQQEYEQDLEKINESIAKFEKLKVQHTKDLNEHSAVIEELLKKYNIREKYKNEIQSEQGKPASEAKNTEEAKSTVAPAEENKDTAPAIDDSQEETIGIEGLAEKEGPHKETDASDVLASIDKSLEDVKNQDTQSRIVVPKQADSKQAQSQQAEPKQAEPKQAESTTPSGKSQTENGAKEVQPDEFFKKVPLDSKNLEGLYLPKKIQNITCSVKNGKLVYTISGINEDEKDFSVDVDANPKRLSREEKSFLSKKINRYSRGNIDAQIFRILKDDRLFRNTNLVYDYMEQIERLSSVDGNEKDDDMLITYDLQDLNSAKLGFLQKGQIKSIARRNFVDGIAEYIKPKSRFKMFIEKMKQKALPAGNKEKQVEDVKDDIITKEAEEMPREDRIYSTYKDLSKEEGFDFDKFCEDMELTPEERSELEVYEKVNEGSKAFHQGIKNPVTYKEASAEPSKEPEQKTNEPRKEEDKEL